MGRRKRLGPGGRKLTGRHLSRFEKSFVGELEESRRRGERDTRERPAHASRPFLKATGPGCAAAARGR